MMVSAALSHIAEQLDYAAFATKSINDNPDLIFGDSVCVSLSRALDAGIWFSTSFISQFDETKPSFD
ncbi:MAG: hypothetical protein Q7S99_15880 [Parvibaculum sp.]|nr:hypothetical protein [Parvibaculum sp.]|tara:strand:+ start:4992 stop:5192 length:201 start_codon:yes stop_codon:yes gene_type:complete